MQVLQIVLRRILPYVLMLLMGGGHVVRAADSLNGLDKAKVEITHETSLYTSIPDRGTLPLIFQVRNRMDQPARWTFRFTSSQGWDRRKQVVSERILEVPAKGVKSVRWEIPVFSNTEFSNSQQQSLRLSVSGPGSSGFEQQLHYSSTRYHHSGSGLKFVAVSPELTITRDRWKYSQFETEITNQNLPIHLSHFDPEALPDGVSGLSGMDVLILTVEEWKELNPRHPMFLKWIAGGGQMLLMSDPPQPSQEIGLGMIQGIPPLETDAFIQLLKRIPTIQGSLADASAFTRSQWELGKKIPAIKRSFGWVMLTVLVIAGLLGPFNIWISFRKRNSMQVIWSTPLISFVVSSLVALGIIFSDGFGGKGQRALRVLLVPVQGTELLVQEQVSRTGVLLGNRFTLPRDTEMYQVKSDTERERANVIYEQTPDGAWAGDWFENRSIQAQVLRRTRSSRAEVVLKSGAPPRVVSTVDAKFARMVIRDDQGIYWIAEQVEPGREQGLREIPARDATKILSELKTRGKSLFPGEKALAQPGWFYAETLEKDRYMETLASVRWTDRPVWFMGPLRVEDQP